MPVVQQQIVKPSCQETLALVLLSVLTQYWCAIRASVPWRVINVLIDWLIDAGSVDDVVGELAVQWDCVLCSLIRWWRWLKCLVCHLNICSLTHQKSPSILTVVLTACLYWSKLSAVRWPTGSVCHYSCHTGRLHCLD